jgi:hypothetical protein
VTHQIDDRGAHADDHHQAVAHIQICDGQHSGERRVGDAEQRGDERAGAWIDRRDQIEQPTATAELIRGNRGVRDRRHQRPEHPRGRAVPELQDVWHRELRDPSHAMREEVHGRNPDPCAGRLPQRRKARAVPQPRSTKEAA